MNTALNQESLWQPIIPRNKVFSVRTTLFENMQDTEIRIYLFRSPSTLSCQHFLDLRLELCSNGLTSKVKAGV